MIPFNKPFLCGNEPELMAAVCRSGKWAGDGVYTKKCEALLEQNTGCFKAFLTNSGTAALEMAAIISNVAPGDEIIMPSFTFPSSANAFALRRAVPKFVDIRPDTLNIDETLIEAAITARTRAIVAVHYAGVACEMDTILAIGDRHGLIVIEDAAQALMATYKGKPLGSFGDFGAVSFHETKNITSGEGGALLINRPAFSDRAEIVRAKGTNHPHFVRGEVAAYSWTDLGSSYLPTEIIAAFLSVQLGEADRITAERRTLWHRYHAALAPLEQEGRLRRPHVPKECEHNAHIYYIILAPQFNRQAVLNALGRKGLQATSHYVPLHASEAGRRYTLSCGSLITTEMMASRLIRLPLWIGLDQTMQQFVVDALSSTLGSSSSLD